MYGILLEAAKHYIIDNYGENTWIWLCKKSTGKEFDIDTKKIYHDNLMVRIATILGDKIFTDKDTILFGIGRYTIQYLIRNGFEKLLRASGKTFKDLLLNLNDHHKYLRYSYHRIKPPTFVILSSTSSCIMLEYTTTRPGYNHYTKGLLFEVAKYIYQLHLIIKINSESNEGSLYRTVFTLELFIGESFKEYEICMVKTGLDTMNMLPKISNKNFFGLLPFHLLIDKNLMIHSAGQRLLEFQPTLINTKFQEYFVIMLPIVKPLFERIMMFSSSTFKIGLKINRKSNESQKSMLYIKGQMIYVKEWSMLLFIGKPNFSEIKSFIDFGLDLQDINLYDIKVEKMILGDTVSKNLLFLLEKQKRKSKELSKIARKLDEQRRKTYQLLEQCLPKEVAQQISQGKHPSETMKAYNSVTICFTKVVNFSNYSSRMCPHKIVDILNQMYTLYDSMTESHNVYKIETISDSYMLVSGAPSPSSFHSAHIIEMALDILEVTKRHLFWPNEAFLDNSTGTQDEQNIPLQLYIGCHTGSIVAGIVGFKSPRYCLFGDTVNTANRMMSTGLPDTVHISSDLAKNLFEYPYILEYRGEQTIKGKGKMTTYFVKNRKEKFTMTDTTTGEELNFRKLLKEDIDNHCRQIDELNSFNSEVYGYDNGDGSSSTTPSEDQSDIEEIQNIDKNEKILDTILIQNNITTQLCFSNNQNERESQSEEMDYLQSKENLTKSKSVEQNNLKYTNKLMNEDEHVDLMKSFKSSKSVIFEDIVNPLTLGLTEIGVVQPENPLQYLGNWLCKFSQKSVSEDP
ncbi:unnamed protein product [Schistosoma bovis]|nr:unnamed protein product [Schistosoma bovis]